MLQLSGVVINSLKTHDMLDHHLDLQSHKKMRSKLSVTPVYLSGLDKY